MDIRITMPEEKQARASYELNSLVDLIQNEADLAVTREEEPAPAGSKDPLILTAIAIAGLALTGVTTVVSVLQYWQSQQSKYSITIKRGNASFQASGIKPKQLDAALAQLDSAASNSTVEVMIIDAQG